MMMVKRVSGGGPLVAYCPPMSRIKFVTWMLLATSGTLALDTNWRSRFSKIYTHVYMTNKGTLLADCGEKNPSNMSASEFISFLHHALPLNAKAKSTQKGKELQNSYFLTSAYSLQNTVLHYFSLSDFHLFQVLEKSWALKKQLFEAGETPTVFKENRQATAMKHAQAELKNEKCKKIARWKILGH